MKERARAIAAAGGVPQALAAGTLPTRADVSVSEGVIVGLLKQGVRKFFGILGHGNTSRLYRKLVIERELAVSAGGWYHGSTLDATTLAVYGSPKPGVTLQQLEQAIDAVIDDMIAKDITADELERAKYRLIADAIYAQDSQSTMARWYGVALTTGSSVEKVQSWPDRIRSVTIDAVRAAAKTWLDKRRSATGYLIKDESQREEKRS
jgi:zinc protease